MEKNLKLISAKYVGGYNDTTIFDVIVNYYDELVHIDVEVHNHDMQIPGRTWQVITDKNISYKERKEIIENIIKDKPIYLADVEPKYYNKEINVSGELKTLQGWYESNYEMLTDYLRLGDKVDEELLNHLIDQLQPKTLTGEMIQIGGAYSANNNGRATYITFARDVPLGDWFYRGACTIGSIMNEEREFEEFDMSYIEEDLEQEETI